MFLKHDYKSYINDPEIRRFREDTMTIPHMVSDEGVTADADGRKIVPIGTLVDKDGKKCAVNGSSITGTPVGITHRSVDVTYGPEPMAVYIRAHLQGELLNFEDEEYSDEIGKAIMEALPEIHIYPAPAEE